MVEIPDTILSTTSDFVDRRSESLLKVSSEIYNARRQFLQESYDGYEADTEYSPTDNEYRYWPAKDSEGRFLGFDSPCKRERALVNELEAQDRFDFVGCGINRLVLAPLEPFENLVVKIGRCGTDEHYGHGRKHNLVEDQYTRRYAETTPILPCLHCSPHGEFAVFPRAGPTLVEEPPGDQHVVDEVCRRLAEEIPYIDAASIRMQYDNFGWWRGSIVSLDYYHPERNNPRGIPPHVDGEAIIDQIQSDSDYVSGLFQSK